MIKVTKRVMTKVVIPVIPAVVKNLSFEIFLTKVNGTKGKDT